jgi:hypothetical protein
MGEGRSSVSTEQRENLDAVLRQSHLPVDIDVSLSAHPAAAERVTA